MIAFELDNCINRIFKYIKLKLMFYTFNGSLSLISNPNPFRESTVLLQLVMNSDFVSN